MSKTVKKLLSVVLSVLVLAAGFSTMLGSFVMAEPEWTYDYQTLIPEFIGTSRDHELLKHNVEVSDGSKLAPEQFGFYDFVSIATNGCNGGSGLWGELVDSKGNPSTVATDTMGIRVTDSFFLNANENRWYVTNRENIDDARAYVTYEVKAGSEFRVQYLTYTEAQWARYNLSADEFRLLEILVSTDGVNFVPAKVENDIKFAPVGGNYDCVTATVANVGAATRFVKVQFSANPHTVTYKQNKGEWVKDYYPQEGWFINKVALEKPETVNTTETVVNFSGNSRVETYTVVENGVEVQKQRTVYFTTVNGKETANSDVFYSYGKAANKRAGLVAYGDGLYQDAKWQNRYKWGAISESNREFFLLVQPGTRFNLTFTDYNGHDDIAKGLVGAGNIETTDDFAVKVFTAVSKQDFANGKYTEHKMVPALQNGGNGFFGTFNFIIPDGHAFVRILHPVSGSIGSVMKLNEDGTPKDYLEENAVKNTAGNDWVHIKGITYTAPTFAVTDDYKTNLSSNAHYKNVFELEALANKFGLAPQYNNNTHVLQKANAETGDIEATAENARTDEQLPYVLYEVKPGTVFKANLHLKYGSNNDIYRKSGYDILAASLNFKEVHFELLTSPTGLAGSWTAQATLGKDGDIYVENTNMDSSAYDVIFGVPENAKYVKIVLHLRGTALNGTNIVSYDDAFGVYGASFTPAETDAAMTTYTYSSDTAIEAFLYSKNPAKFLATTGAVAAGNGVKHEENWTGNTGLGGILLEAYSSGRGYLVYNVQPGTVFEARTYVSPSHKANFQGAQNGLFEYIFSGSNTVKGTYNAITNTVTDYRLSDKGSLSKEQVTSFVVPEGMNFIKIEFPATQNSSNNSWANHGGSVNWVSFVPAKHVENGITFDYSKIDSVKVASVLDDLTQFGAVAASEWNLKVTNNAVNNENFGTCIENVSSNYVAKVDKEWGKVARPYMIYEVKPGTTFAANILFRSTRNTINNTYLPNALAAGLITDESKFEFTFEASASKDGGWKNAVDTSSLAVEVIDTMLYSVPDDCKYVKITFPQRGAVITNTKSVITDGKGVARYAASAMNDMAFIEDVTYVPFGAADADVVVENDYTAKSELAENTKSDYELYDFDKVVSSANGIVAEADGAYVTYKVSNAEKLVLKSDATLKFAVSYDNDKFVDAQVYAYGGVYTIDTLDGKQYVKVALDAGETITAVSAAALNPTVTFVVPHMNKEVNVDVPYYGAAAIEPEVTARLGYEFNGWSKAFDAVWFDVKTVYQYKKAAADITVAVDQSFGDGTAKISQVAGNPVDSASATVQFNDRVVVEAPAACEGLVFDKWVDAESGKVISNSHKFSFLASESITLEAHYNENKTDIGEPIYTNKTAPYTVNANGSWNMSVLWRINSVGNVTETGILISNTADALSDDAACDSVVNGTETDTIKKRAHTNSAAGTTLMYTITKIADGQVRYARPYAIIDGDIYYGDALSQTYTAAE